MEIPATPRAFSMCRFVHYHMNKMCSIMNPCFMAIRVPHLLAQVEMRATPALLGRAFVLATGVEPRAQVLGISPSQPTCGCALGAPLATWLRWLPDLLVVPAPLAHAASLLEDLRRRLAALTPDLRSARQGQYLLNLSGMRHLHPDVPRLGRCLLEELRSELGIVAAAGIGVSPLAAQLLARHVRAGGLACPEDGRSGGLDGFPLAGLPGVPPSLLRALDEAGVRSVGEARRLPLEQLRCLFGAAGLRLRALLDELDLREMPVSAPLLMRAARRLDADSVDPARIGAVLLDLLETVHLRAREDRLAPRRLDLRLVWNDGQVQERGIRLEGQAGESRRQTLRRQGGQLLAQALEERRLRVRELAVELAAVRESGQLSLFDAARAEARERRLDEAVGLIRAHWGPDLLRVGLQNVRRAH
jgi:nucleotidyltransferase/DNA polymerase involved in DNA repair